MTDTESAENSAAPSSFEKLREQFEEKCVLMALVEAREVEPNDPPDVYFLDEDTGRVHRVLDAMRGSPDSGWFVLALGGSHPDDGYERQLRIHDSDTHRILIDD